MIRKIKEQLLKYPTIYKLLRATYRSVIPLPAPPPTPLQSALSKSLQHKQSVFFLQVGSNDGKQGDPLHDFIVANKNWQGIFIEPVGFLFERLKRNYGNSRRFIFERTAIAAKRDRIELYYVSEKAKAELGDAVPYWYDQLGSFDKSHILKHLDGILEPYIVSEQIDAVPLQDILDKHAVGSLDLLHIDTEGYDYKVLATLDFSVYQPSVILYEHIHLSDGERYSAETLLEKHGYACVKYGSDTLATHISSVGM